MFTSQADNNYEARVKRDQQNARNKAQEMADAVHSVLARQSTASQAAAGLEKELVRITGFATAHK